MIFYLLCAAILGGMLVAGWPGPDEDGDWSTCWRVAMRVGLVIVCCGIFYGALAVLVVGL